MRRPGQSAGRDFVEPGGSATNDRRPAFRRMIEAGTSPPAPFDVVEVLSVSRVFRDPFKLEFHVRKPAGNGALPPIGYRTVAAGQRGAKVRKQPET